MSGNRTKPTFFVFDFIALEDAADDEEFSVIYVMEKFRETANDRFAIRDC